MADSDTPTSADREYGFRTRAIHAGNIPDAVTGARALPIYQTSAFVFDDTADAAARFALQKYGNIYSRLANPTVASFEERVASLEGGLGAVATASGRAKSVKAAIPTITPASRHRSSASICMPIATKNTALNTSRMPSKVRTTWWRCGVSATIVPSRNAPSARE